jgi:hypothetical protein
METEATMCCYTEDTLLTKVHVVTLNQAQSQKLQSFAPIPDYFLK